MGDNPITTAAATSPWWVALLAVLITTLGTLGGIYLRERFKRRNEPPKTTEEFKDAFLALSQEQSKRLDRMDAQSERDRNTIDRLNNEIDRKERELASLQVIHAQCGPQIDRLQSEIADLRRQLDACEQRKGTE